ncbi:MAG: hypothetical protein U0929_11060 [Planctomycetaceae bacterium]
MTTLLREAEHLLRSCSWTQQAEWFCKKAECLEALNEDQIAASSHLNDIQGVLAGAGSFSDLPMVPSSESGITESEARDKAWELVGAIDDAIDAARSASL